MCFAMHRAVRVCAHLFVCTVRAVLGPAGHRLARLGFMGRQGRAGQGIHEGPWSAPLLAGLRLPACCVLPLAPQALEKMPKAIQEL